MSTSAADHYKVVLAIQKEAKAREQAEDASKELELIREEVSRLQNDVDTKQAIETAAKQEMISAMKKTAQVPKPSAVEMDPHTGLPVGERIPCTSEEREYVDKISEVWQALQDGNVDKARVLEREATEIDGKRDTKIEPHLVGLESGAIQVSSADFCEPNSLPELQVLDKTFAYARDNPEKTSPRMDMFDIMMLVTDSMRIGTRADSYPKDVNTTILRKIMEQRKQVEECAKESRREEDDSDDEEESDHDDGEESKANDEEESNDEGGEDFEMSDEAWDAVETAIRNQILNDREKNEQELTLPRKGSATLARYNPNAHFCFQSDTAVASVAELDDALACCKLRNRPMDWFKPTDGSASKRSQQPFEYTTLGSLEGFDIDGDLMAMCGDLYYNEIYGSKPYVAFSAVPYPTNLEEAATMSDLKDRITGNDGPWDDKFSTEVYKSRSEFFNNCFADAETKSVWASSFPSGTVHGFSTAPGLSRSERPIGLLAFDKVEVAKQNRYVNGRFNIVRCGDHVVGSGGTGRLSLWNMKKATDEFPGMVPAKDNHTERTDDRGDDTSDDEIEYEEDGEPPPKQQKVEGYKGLSPKIVTVEENDFSIGDIQCVMGTQILVGPRHDGEKPSESCAVRLYDIASESVIGLFCGGQSDASIGRQYCVESSLVFTTDFTGTAFAWDIRTCRPVIMLHSREGQILGVPGDSGNFAFTYGGHESESISCWDLRMPASHAYTMATGNSNVNSLHWHAGTSSLFAATSTKHHITHGRCRSYMYGNDLSEEEEYEISSFSYWPRAAKHERNYFGPDDWHSDRPVVLHYAFDNGKPMNSL